MATLRQRGERTPGQSPVDGVCLQIFLWRGTGQGGGDDRGPQGLDGADPAECRLDRRGDTAGSSL